MVFSDDSDPECRALLDALLDRGCYGGSGTKAGIPWSQDILLEGEFTSGELVTETGPDKPQTETYRLFRLKDLKLQFPLSIWRRPIEGPLGDPPHLETHFSVNSLFPQGLELNGQAIDLKKHVN